MKLNTSLFISLISYFSFVGFLVQSGYSQDNIKEIMLDTVEVTGFSHFNNTPAPIFSIDRQKLRHFPSRDVGDYLRSIPNVNGIRKGGAAVDPVVRGYKFSQLNVVLNNGVKIENGCPNRMDPVTCRIEVEDIAEMNVVKGPFDLRYGPAFGGVINLVADEPRPYENFEVHGDFSSGYESNWNGKKYYGSINGGNDRAYFQVSGGYRQYGNYSSGIVDGSELQFNTSFKKYNYGAKLGFSINPNHRIIMGVEEIHGRDVLYPALPMDEKSDDTRMLSVDYYGLLGHPVFRSIDAKIYQSDVHHVMDNSRRPSATNMLMVADVESLNTGGRVLLEMNVKNARVTTGLDIEDIRKDGVRTGTMEMMGQVSKSRKNLWNDAHIVNYGFFTEYMNSFSSWVVSASIRADINEATSDDTLQLVKDGIHYFDNLDSRFINLSFNAAVTRVINPWFNLSLGVGRGVRSPNMLERYIKLLPVGFDRFDYLGNPQLKPEVNNEVDVTLQFEKSTLGSAYLNFFYSYVQDFILGTMVPSSVITPQSNGVLGVRQFNNTDYIISRGFELGFTTPAQYPLGGRLIAAYTSAFVPEIIKYTMDGKEVVNSEKIKNDPLPEIPPLEATMSLYYQFLKGDLVPEMSLRMVAKQKNTSDAFYENSTPVFTVLDVKARYRVNQLLFINAGISNLLDNAYYEHLNRRIIGTTDNLYEPGRVFFITANLTF